MPSTMEAIIITKFGGPEVLEIQSVPRPDPVQGEVLIEVKAFGLNHAEMHMRKGEWDEWNPISGLECVGVVAACPGGEFPVGEKVIGVMGGMGRNRPGGYGGFVNVPVSNVVLIDSKLPWEQLAAIPEVYSTAYSCISTILNVQKGESVLIRGATSTVGQAALHLAVDIGANVTATTRRQERFQMVKNMGATDAKIEQKQLQEQFGEGHRFDKVLNLIGNCVLLESIALTKAGGRMLQAGWLGGLAPVVDFNPMIQMESGVHFSLFHSKNLGTPDFPMSGIPLQQIVSKIEKGAWNAEPAHVFDKADITRAHEMLDSHNAGGLKRRKYFNLGGGVINSGREDIPASTRGLAPALAFFHCPPAILSKPQRQPRTTTTDRQLSHASPLKYREPTQSVILKDLDGFYLPRIRAKGHMDRAPNSEDGPASPQSYSRKPLSCSTCRIKKIRCDKRMPCCHCTKANIRCTFPSQRKPRERKPHLRNRQPEEQSQTTPVDDALADRLQSLEAQVSSLQTQLEDVKGDKSPPRKYELVKRAAVRPPARSAGVVPHIKSSFWASINFELQRQLSSRRSKGIQLQLQYGELAGPSFPPQSQPNVSMLLFKSFQGLSHPLHHPPETHIMLFWHVFKENVEPMIKLLHSPTMANLVERALWHRHTLSTAEHALLFSVYYVATAAMGEEMIIREFSVSKAALLSRMRVLVEQALVAAKFATTVDVTVLQATMQYILVLRKTGEARSAGSLVGVVVHLSQCLRLQKDSEGVYDLTPFQREMRRRLFWCVVILDQRSAEDLGTDPMVPEEVWNTPLPLNINDDDISENSSALPESRDGMTDMTFSLIRLHTLQTSVRIRRLASEDPDQTIESLDQLCEDVWQETHTMIHANYVDPNPNHELVWAAKAMASCIISKMKLTDQCSFYSPEDAHDMTESMQGRSMAHMTSAIRVMEENHSANVDDRWAKWKWVFVAYSRWHGSAILFKEMLRWQWTPVSEQGWVTLHKIMGDSNLGELECLRDQPVMPLPFGFIYELTKNYRESEYARLRSQPDKARRLCDETVRPGPSGGDRAAPGVSASSLERWQQAAGLVRTVQDISAQGPPHGVIELLGEGENAATDESSLVIAQSLPETYDHAQLPAAALLDYEAAGTEQWMVGDAIPVEYTENILDGLF